MTGPAGCGAPPCSAAASIDGTGLGHDHAPGVRPDLIAAELLVVALLAAAVLYLWAARRSVGAWPVGRTGRWVTGIAVAVAGIVGPMLLPAADGVHDLRLHVAGHLLVGMVAPLLLVTAAPVTLALRTLPTWRARALARLLRSRPIRMLTHPAVAATLDVGGLWLVYRTDLLTAVPAALLHLHMLLAGYLFAFSLVGRDPAPHRPGLAVRAGVLVAAVAAHDVLAKLIYGTPPPGVPAAQAEFAGQLMYYGATPVHVVLFVLLGREWYAAQGRRHRSSRSTPGHGPRTDAVNRAAVPRRQAASPTASQVESSSRSPRAPSAASTGTTGTTGRR